MSVVETPVTVTTMYGYKSQQPLVCLGWGDTMPKQLPVAKAREIAMMLLEAAEAAEQDAFVFEWVRDVLGLTEDKAVHVMDDYRKWREKRR